MSTLLPRMLAKALALLGERIPIDIALAHLFADSRGHLDIEMRDVTLALDALVEANAFTSNGVTFVNPKEYDELLPTLEQALDDALQGHDKREDLVERLTERLRKANDVSHGERRRKFWRRIGFQLKPDERMRWTTATRSVTKATYCAAPAMYNTRRCCARRVSRGIS